MVTRSRIIVVVLLLLILAVAAWSKLSNVKDSDFEPQRIRLDEHPALRNHAPDGG